MGLRKRHGIWHARFWAHGERVERSTKESDRKKAQPIARAFELAASDPHHERARQATLTDAFNLLLADRRELVRAKR